MEAQEKDFPEIRFLGNGGGLRNWISQEFVTLDMGSSGMGFPRNSFFFLGLGGPGMGCPRNAFSWEWEAQEWMIFQEFVFLGMRKFRNWISEDFVFLGNGSGMGFLRNSFFFSGNGRFRNGISEECVFLGF